MVRISKSRVTGNCFLVGLLTVGAFIQRLSKTQKKKKKSLSNLVPAEAPSVLEVLISIHSLNEVRMTADDVALSLLFSYGAGNIIGLVMMHTCIACSNLRPLVGVESRLNPLSTTTYPINAKNIY